MLTDGNLVKEVLIYAVLLSFVAIALTEVIKVSIPNLRSSLLPLVSILVGIVLATFTGFVAPEMELVERIGAGVIAGITASGLFQIPKQLKEEALNRVLGSKDKDTKK